MPYKNTRCIFTNSFRFLLALDNFFYFFSENQDGFLNLQVQKMPTIDIPRPLVAQKGPALEILPSEFSPISQYCCNMKYQEMMHDAEQQTEKFKDPHHEKEPLIDLNNTQSASDVAVREDFPKINEEIGQLVKEISGVDERCSFLSHLKNLSKESSNGNAFEDDTSSVTLLEIAGTISGHVEEKSSFEIPVNQRTDNLDDERNLLKQPTYSEMFTIENDSSETGSCISTDSDASYVIMRDVSIQLSLDTLDVQFISEEKIVQTDQQTKNANVLTANTTTSYEVLDFKGTSFNSEPDVHFASYRTENQRKSEVKIETPQLSSNESEESILRREKIRSRRPTQYSLVSSGPENKITSETVLQALEANKEKVRPFKKFRLSNDSDDLDVLEKFNRVPSSQNNETESNEDNKNLTVELGVQTSWECCIIPKVVDYSHQKCMKAKSDDDFCIENNSVKPEQIKKCSIIQKEDESVNESNLNEHVKQNNEMKHLESKGFLEERISKYFIRKKNTTPKEDETLKCTAPIPKFSEKCCGVAPQTYDKSCGNEEDPKIDKNFENKAPQLHKVTEEETPKNVDAHFDKVTKDQQVNESMIGEVPQLNDNSSIEDLKVDEESNIDGDKINEKEDKSVDNFNIHQQEFVNMNNSESSSCCTYFSEESNSVQQKQLETNNVCIGNTCKVENVNDETQTNTCNYYSCHWRKNQCRQLLRDYNVNDDQKDSTHTIKGIGKYFCTVPRVKNKSKNRKNNKSNKNYEISECNENSQGLQNTTIIEENTPVKKQNKNKKFDQETQKLCDKELGKTCGKETNKTEQNSIKNNKKKPDIEMDEDMPTPQCYRKSEPGEICSTWQRKTNPCHLISSCNEYLSPPKQIETTSKTDEKIPQTNNDTKQKDIKHQNDRIKKKQNKNKNQDKTIQYNCGNDNGVEKGESLKKMEQQTCEYSCKDRSKLSFESVEKELKKISFPEKCTCSPQGIFIDDTDIRKSGAKRKKRIVESKSQTEEYSSNSETFNSSERFRDSLEFENIRYRNILRVNPRMVDGHQFGIPHNDRHQRRIRNCSDSTDSTYSEGEIKCKCSTSIGEIHLCKYAAKIRSRMSYLKEHPRKFIEHEFGNPNVKLIGGRMYYRNWCAYYISDTSDSSR